jgi:hypothetical protein
VLPVIRTEHREASRVCDGSHTLPSTATTERLTRIHGGGEIIEPIEITHLFGFINIIMRPSTVNHARGHKSLQPREPKADFPADPFPGPSPLPRRRVRIGLGFALQNLRAGCRLEMPICANLAGYLTAASANWRKFGLANDRRRLRRPADAEQLCPDWEIFAPILPIDQ